MADGLFACTDRLEKFPRSGRVIPEIGRPEFREIIYRRSYRVIYRVDRSSVSILTVRHTAQEFDDAEIGSNDETSR